MRRIYVQIILMALLLCSCSGKTGQQGKTVANDSLSAVADLTTVEPADDGALAVEVQQRVAAMYDDVFDHYNRNEFASWSSHDLYFSDSLKRLWSMLPDDEEIIDYDPWTWAQDYDTLVYQRIDVSMLTQDTAQAIITLSLWKNYPRYPVILDMVREKHGDSSATADWYVNDIRNGEHPEWPSIADAIIDYIKEFKQDK